MPTKRTIAAIVFFWFITTGYVAYRDLLPRLFASSEPTIAIDLVDEAAHNVDVRWGIYRGNEEIGRLTSELKYSKEDDTFEFTCDYKNLKLLPHLTNFTITELKLKDKITREGNLKQQSLDGKVELELIGANLTGVSLKGEVKLQGTVVDGLLIAECGITSPLGNFKETLDPVPVPKGRPLNPLQPVNRLTNLKPGHSWLVQMNSPLEDAVFKTMEKLGFKLAERKSGQLIAKLLKEPQELDWYGQMVPCWVIEYRQDQPVARTWVKVSDGRVLKQEAFRDGEHLSIVRDR
jgi:hypothetical protein